MRVYLTHWRTLFICLSILGLTPSISESRNDQDNKQYKKSQQQFLQGERSPGNPQKGDRSKKRDQVNQNKSRKEQSRQSPPHRSEQHRPERRDRSDRDKSRKDSGKYKPPTRRPEHQPPKRHERTERDHRTRSTPKPRTRSKHDRHYDRYSKYTRRHPHQRHETYRYHTHYIAPIWRYYYPLGFRIMFLPRTHIRIFVHGLPYFYFGGVFYRYHSNGYIVVRAPIGAVVNVLPYGFIAFSLGGFTYYYVNDTYYLWDDNYAAYVVVEKPVAADEAIAAATEDRLFVYPNHGQNEEQQSTDRYECHRWAVHESHADPSLDDEDDLSLHDKRNYKRAISACLEGRGYTVK